MQDGEITEKNVTVSVVGKDMAFTILEDEALLPYITGTQSHMLGTSVCWGLCAHAGCTCLPQLLPRVLFLPWDLSLQLKRRWAV